MEKPNGQLASGTWGTKSGKRNKLKIKKRLSASVKGKRDWKFESGIIYHCSKEKSMGKGKYQKWHSTQETQLRSRGGVLGIVI